MSSLNLCSTNHLVTFKPRLSLRRLLYLICPKQKLLEAYSAHKKTSSRFCRSRQRKLVRFSIANLLKAQVCYSKNHQRAKARCLESQQKLSLRSSTSLRTRFRELYSASHRKKVCSKPSRLKSKKRCRRQAISLLSRKRVDCSKPRRQTKNKWNPFKSLLRR